MAAALLLGACGLEDYPYIYPIPQSNVQPQGNNRAVVRVPNNNSGTYFTNWIIFYRIYLSDNLIDPPLPGPRGNYSTINARLDSDYNTVSPYIDSTTLVNKDMDILFTKDLAINPNPNQSYKYLALEGINIDSVLSSSSFDHNLIFNFSSTNTIPTMEITDLGGNPTGGPYPLLRSSDGYPSQQSGRYFSGDVYMFSPTIGNNTNADVVTGITTGPSGVYLYATLFIAAVGFNPETLTYIYSTPTLIHTFLLPASPITP